MDMDTTSPGSPIPTEEPPAPRAPAPSQPARAPVPQTAVAPRAPAPQTSLAAAPRPAALAPVAPRPAAPVSSPQTPTSLPAVDVSCNEDESKRLLVKFAGAHLPSNKPPPAAGAALLSQFARLAERSGLTVVRNQNGTVLISNGEAETVLLFEEGLFGTIKKDRKSFPALAIVWNPFEKKFEGTHPEREPLPNEVEFRIPRRSALAVLTETVLQRLSTGEK